MFLGGYFFGIVDVNYNFVNNGFVMKIVFVIVESVYIVLVFDVYGNLFIDIDFF